MEEHFLLELSLIFVLGFAARWVAWQLHLPSILLLLIAGLVAGPWQGWLNPDELLGNSLLPFVSISVALILFEGGLSLSVRELKGNREVAMARLLKNEGPEHAERFLREARLSASLHDLKATTSMFSGEV